MKKIGHFISSASLTLSVIGAVVADDLDLYLSTNSSTGRPKVLIIFDNSGSMNTTVPGSKPRYDSTTTYPDQGSIVAGRIYWSTDGEPPPPDSPQFFDAASNRCAQSLDPLNRYGFFTTRVRVRSGSGVNAVWDFLTTSSSTYNASLIDCEADVLAGDARNPGSPAQTDGFPVDGNSPYTALAADSDVPWGDRNGRTDNVTLYTSNYMNWYHNSTLTPVSRTRLDIAKEVVTGIVDTNPAVDFGLMFFNTNTTAANSGGRVVQKLNTDMTLSQRLTLIDTINNVAGTTYTPLCETMYEAYRYFSGSGVHFGDDEPTATPPRDTSAESGGTYISPVNDCQQVYVILMTDGLPTRDTHADALVDALPGIGTVSGDRLDELAGWLYANDLDNDDTNGIQRVVTYTIGFHTDQALLSDTARNGGGEYFTATTAGALQRAFQASLNQIVDTAATFTSPSIAVNSFNRTRSLDSVYFAMFKPDSRPRWHGNLKKLRINAAGELVDADGNLAIDPATGNIKDSARTLWSPTADGGFVERGGAGALLASRNPTTRVLKTNTGTGGALENLDPGNSSLTNALFGAASDAERVELINFARGFDVDDEDNDGSTSDARPWILGDPLHSQPLVINYGARSGHTADDPDVRILIGTNAGFLHMFDAGTGQESWAFFPKETAAVTKLIRDNSPTTSHPYAVDGTAVSYIVDNNSDGTIDGTDKVYVYFGMRRGGSDYYALDVSDPDNPRLLWHIDNTTPGFGELGQSWSEPAITSIPGHGNPVLVIGAGYDPNKDLPGPGTDDSQGRGLLIIDALTGALVWSATPAPSTATNLRVTGITDSVAAKVAVIDSNGDKITDRIYFADTGGNVWRADLPGSSLPTGAQNTWSVFKFAALGGTTATTDRRFYHGPDIVQTRFNNTDFDAIMIGSGNRSDPTETTVENRFYMLKDLETTTSYHGTGGTPVPAPITESDLYDATDNLVQAGNTADQSAALTAINSARGWLLRLTRPGEKSLATPLTLSGTTFFTTFVPVIDDQVCLPVPGEGFLYSISLHTAAAVFDHEVDTTPGLITTADRAVSVGYRIPDAVTPHFGENTIRIIGVGAGDGGSGSYDTGSSLIINSTYWYKEDN